MLKNTTLALVAAVALAGLTACGSDTETPGTASQPKETATRQDKEKKDAETKAKDAPELKKDVTIAACESGKGIGVRATLEVTNSLDKPMEYIGTITFRDASGKDLTEGIFNTGTIQPGKKATEQIPGANVYEVVKDVTCEVTEVKIDEPV